MTGSRSMDRDFETRYLIWHTRPDSEPQNAEVWSRCALSF